MVWERRLAARVQIDAFICTRRTTEISDAAVVTATPPAIDHAGARPERGSLRCATGRTRNYRAAHGRWLAGGGLGMTD